MKSRDILDAVGEIDQDLIEDAAPDLNRAKKKSKRPVLFRSIAAAACFVLIICGALAARPLFDRVNEPVVNEESEMAEGSEVVTDSEDAAKATEEERNDIDTADRYSPIESAGEMDTCGEMQTEYCEPYLQLVDGLEGFDGYSLTYIPCSEDRVGEKIAEININYKWSDAPDDIIVCNADVFNVIGRDGSISLCYRYTEANGLYDSENYYYMNVNQASFERLSELFNVTGIDENASFSETVNYSKKSQYSYCDRFAISEELSREIISALKSCDGEVDNETTYGELLTLFDERVTFKISQSDYSVYMEVTNNGYVYCTVFGSRVFYIGHDAAQKIIDLVLSGEPVGYEWNEEYSEWYTICEEDEIRENPPATFSDMMALREMDAGFSLNPYVTYLASKIKLAPPYFILADSLLENIEDIFRSIDGRMLSPNEDVGPAYECVKFKISREGREPLEFHVFSAGYISFGGFDYMVGTDVVEKIISIVVLEGEPADGYVWNKSEERWQIVSSDESETYGCGVGYDTYDYEEDTAPYETETAIESVIETWEYETETAIFEYTE